MMLRILPVFMLYTCRQGILQHLLILAIVLSVIHLKLGFTIVASRENGMELAEMLKLYAQHLGRCFIYPLIRKLQ